MRGSQPTVTRAATLRRYRTPRQRHLADRDILITVARAGGCSLRLIASGLGLHPERIRQILANMSDSSAPPEEPNPLRATPLGTGRPAENLAPRRG